MKKEEGMSKDKLDMINNGLKIEVTLSGNNLRSLIDGEIEGTFTSRCYITIDKKVAEQIKKRIKKS